MSESRETGWPPQSSRDRSPASWASPTHAALADFHFTAGAPHGPHTRPAARLEVRHWAISITPSRPISAYRSPRRTPDTVKIASNFNALTAGLSGLAPTLAPPC